MRNGSAAAVAPKTYDSKANAKRAAQRQVDTLIALAIEVAGPIFPDDAAGDLSRSDVDNFVQLEVVDKDPGYV
jgi:hypothetical protein